MPLGNSTQWRVLVPGPYTVEGEITINGEQHFNGEVIELTRSTVQLETGSIPGGLIWGRNLERPAAPPPARPYWTDF
jgi:alpha-D-ribose 1-methylphosphonate 5-triphosphate synthase subunit PhnG